MKKIIGVIGNPSIGKEMLRHLSEEVVINNWEVKDAMRAEYLQPPQDYVKAFNAFKEFEDFKVFDKPKSKYHK